MFRDWNRLLPASIEVLAAEFPGRGTRFAEPPATSVETLAADFAAAMQPELHVPYALYGHSLGALVAFETARRLQASRSPGPVMVIVGAMRAPHVPMRRPPMRRLNDEELLAEMQRRYNSIPSEILQEREMLELMLPVLRADLTAYETYQLLPGPVLETPLLACAGATDEAIPSADTSEWAGYTNGPFELKIFSGDHFFLNSCRDSLLGTIAASLERRLSI